MSLSKTQIIFILSLFFITCNVIMGFIGQTFNATELGEEVEQKGNTALVIFNNVITGYSILPWWINAIIFGSLGVTITFLIVSSLPTFNGGG